MLPLSPLPYGLAWLGLFTASLLLTRLTLAWLRRRRIMDHPNARSSHSAPTPRGGGIAIVILLFLLWAGRDFGRFFGLTDTGEPLPPAHLLAPLAFLGLAAVCWRDDLSGLPPWLRLLAQLAACAAALPWALGTPGWPAAAETAALVILWAGFLNFFNFMDGIDGLTGVEAVSIAAGLFLLALFLPPAQATGLRDAAAAIAAIAAGFLVWNWHPARVFAGDVGSVPLGMALGGLLLQLAAAGFWAAAVILPLYYLADAGLTLTRRILHGHRPWRAHREHCYQIAVRRGQGHARVSGAVAGVNLLLALLALLSLLWPLIALGLALLLMPPLLWWMAGPAIWRGAGA